MPSALDGISVLSLAVNLPGPVAVRMLADLGAKVTKIEPPGGDLMALTVPDWYAKLHDGYRIVPLNLKDPGSRTRIDALLAETDLLLSSYRPAALDRLGLGWESLHARFPRLCQVAIVGYPPPDENIAGHDLTYQATMGLLTPPAMPKALVADLAGSQRAVIAALSLLYARDRGQPAGYETVALSEASRLFALPLAYGLTQPGGGLGGGLPGYNLYPSSTGWVAVAALEPHFLENLRVALGLETVTHDALAAKFREKPAVEWEAWGHEQGLPIAAVRERPTEETSP